MSIGDKPIIGITAAQQAAASAKQIANAAEAAQTAINAVPGAWPRKNIVLTPCCPAWGLRPAQSSQWLRWELRRRFRS